MTAQNDEALALLTEIRDLLSRIYICFEGQYLEIQKQRVGEKLEIFEGLLSSTRRRIYPLLFDPRRLSQTEIASRANSTQPTVSKFVSALLDHDLIERIEDEEGNTAYRDKYDLMKLLRE